MKIFTDRNIIFVETSTYRWNFDINSDIFEISDSKGNIISSSVHTPLFIVFHEGRKIPLKLDKKIDYEIKDNSVSIYYKKDSDNIFITLTWNFNEENIVLTPLKVIWNKNYEIISINYFSKIVDNEAESYIPSFYSRYVMVPGLAMNTNINPVIDLHSRLSVLACLGSGAMRGPGFSQQWGLPSHYFCTFNTCERWNSIGANSKISEAACWGLLELPEGDFRLDVREIAISPVLNLRSDLWHQYDYSGTLTLGFKFLITFGSIHYEAVRAYYRTLIDLKVIKSKSESNSNHKNEVLLSPQYNTWGVEVAKAMQPEELTEEIVRDIYNKFRNSAMKAKTFVIDDKWEGVYGELSHDPDRFPNFLALLDEIRNDGYFIGLWAAFLRCQNPETLGLTEDDLIQTYDKKPLWLHHQTAAYGIFDITKPNVQKVLRERARNFILKYNPDIIKFDFGYELPSLDKAAPYDMTYSGEKLIKIGLEVIVGEMKKIKPDLVVMYYGLSPLLIDYYDLHSLDDLVYCGGDYDLESNRRIFFSSLCGEIGMPTYSSSGYNWATAKDIWFDAVASGIPGSLHCFEGDENNDLPEISIIAKYNGLSAIARRTCNFSVKPVNLTHLNGMRAALSSSWERIENNKTVLLAMRKIRLDGKAEITSYGDIIFHNTDIVVASLTDDSISESSNLGVVPFDNGTLVIKTIKNKAEIIEHYINNTFRTYNAVIYNNELEIHFSEYINGNIVEWIEIRTAN